MYTQRKTERKRVCVWERQREGKRERSEIRRRVKGVSVREKVIGGEKVKQCVSTINRCVWKCPNSGSRFHHQIHRYHGNMLMMQQDIQFG